MISSNGNMIFTILFTLIALDSVKSQVPSSYDSRSLWKHCSGFSMVLNQGHCSSCCAMAISSSLSSRECMRDGRDIAYSAEQIWDCAGPSALATCADGSYLDQMLISLGRGSRSSQSLIKSTCALYTEKDANASKCKVASDACSADLDGPSQVEGSVFYDLLWYSGNAEFGAWAASKAMMSEIWANGPVVAVLSLNSREYGLFGQNSYLKNKKVFIPMPVNDTSTSIYYVRHCLTVYGWGQDEVTGLNYWLVQNSWGEEWGDGGTARILRGMNFLEVEWRGISTSPRPCIKGDMCLNSTFRRLLNPKNDSEVNQNIKQMSYHLYISTSSAVSTYAGKLSNIEIFIITMASSLCIAALICIFVVPSSSLSSTSLPFSAFTSNNSRSFGAKEPSYHQPRFLYNSGNNYMPQTIDPQFVFGSSPYFSGYKWK